MDLEERFNIKKLRQPILKPKNYQKRLLNNLDWPNIRELSEIQICKTTKLMDQIDPKSIFLLLKTYLR